MARILLSHRRSTLNNILLSQQKGLAYVKFYIEFLFLSKIPANSRGQWASVSHMNCLRPHANYLFQEGVNLNLPCYKECEFEGLNGGIKVYTISKSTIIAVLG